MFIRLGLLSLALASVAQATDLINKDSVTYEIAVTSGVSTMKTTIAGRTVKIGVCATAARRCVVTVVGVGEIEVSGGDDVIIRDGKLSKK